EEQANVDRFDQAAAEDDTAARPLDATGDEHTSDDTDATSTASGSDASEAGESSGGDGDSGTDPAEPPIPEAGGSGGASLAGAVPVILALAAGRFGQALALGGLCGTAAALVVVPVRGRPALRWLGHLLLYRAGIALGWSRWQSRAVAGQAADLDEPDLPGVLAR